MRKSATLLWIPLRPRSNWRGEGIAGTIDGLVSRWKGNELIVVALRDHSEVMKERSNANVKFYSVPQIRPTFEYLEGIVAGRIYRMLRFPEKFLNNFLYVTYCLFYFLFFRLSNKIEKVWCPTFAALFASSDFKKTKIINFWDGFVFEYYGFSHVDLPIFIRIKKFLASADLVVTQSQHNKSYLRQIFGINPEKIIVVPNPNPSLSGIIDADIRDTLKQNRESVLDYWKAEKSGLAIKSLRDLRNRSMLKRLIDESSESSFVIFCSTQMRPYKGFNNLFKFLTNFQKKYPDLDVRVILTGDLENYLYSTVMDQDTYNWIYSKCYQLSRVDNFNHALLYLISDLVLHPSYAEGGHGVYPLFEAASVGTPCIMNDGRHAKELLSEFPELRGNIVDMSNFENFEEKLRSIISDMTCRHALLKKVDNLFNNKEKAYSLYFSVLGSNLDDNK